MLNANQRSGTLTADPHPRSDRKEVIGGLGKSSVSQDTFDLRELRRGERGVMASMVASSREVIFGRRKEVTVTENESRSLFKIWDPCHVWINDQERIVE